VRFPPAIRRAEQVRQRPKERPKDRFRFNPSPRY
jgi:hypothetical protein